MRRRDVPARRKASAASGPRPGAEQHVLARAGQAREKVVLEESGGRGIEGDRRLAGGGRLDQGAGLGRARLGGIEALLAQVEARGAGDSSWVISPTRRW